MRDAFVVLLVVGGISIELAILIYFFRREFSAWWRGDNPWRVWQIRKSLRTYHKRLRSPQPHEVEEKLGAFLPSSLLALYSDTKTILTNDFQVLPKIRYSEVEAYFIIAEFLPLDAQSLKDVGDMSEFGSVFCFASDGCGNYFWLSLDKERQKDAPVWQFYRDGRENIKVAASLEEFLGWPRVAG